MPLTEAIGLATASAKSAGGPFGAIVITKDGQHFQGTNQVTTLNDPTAHAEVQAIRAAAKETGFDLSGATLYTSCQPCPMCLTAALWARIDRVVYAANQKDAADAGFDDSEFYRQLSGGLDTVTDMEIVEDPHPSRLEPFQAWAENAQRTEY